MSELTPSELTPLGDDVHLRDYVHVILSRWPMALTVWATVLLMAVLYTWTRTPRYMAAARILVENNEVNLTDMKGAYDQNTPVSGQREFMQTQVKLLSSQPVMEATLIKADLQNDPDFREAKDPVAELARELVAQPVRGTHLIDIAIEREDPQQAARIVNAIVDSFLTENRNRRLGVSGEGVEELQHKQEDLRVKLDAASAELQAFMVSNNIVSFEKVQNVVLENLMAFNKELTEKEPARMALQARVEAARAALARGEPAESLPDVMASEVVRSLRLELIKNEQEYTQLLARLGSQHPQLLALSTQIDTLRTKIAIEAGSILKSLETGYEQARMEEDLLKARVREQESQVFRFNELTSRYNVLKQNKDSIESTYQTIVRRIQEIDSNRMGGQGENIFVISRATPPTQRSWPNRSRNMVIALFLGAVSAVSLCFFINYMDVTIKSEADVQHLLQTRVLAGIPGRAPDEQAPSLPDRVVQETPHSHTAEAFRTLRTAVTFTPTGDVLRSLVVTSTLSSEGKTFVAVNLATAIANLNRRTLLIDADMRRPRLHHVFPVSTLRGLSDLLASNPGVPTEDAIQSTDIPNLWVLPCGPLPPNPAELLDSTRFVALIIDLLAKFDTVIIDSPPGLQLVDSTIISKHLDGLLLVVRSYSTAKTPARRFAQSLHASGVPLLGVVLNNVDVPEHGYGYYYGQPRYHYSYRAQTESDAQPVAPWRAALRRLQARFPTRPKRK
ncbi:MAG: polysaccharide biosynthesis tyrosine autokinase [Lentisphaerae bacterium]|nr:polysaccharide biosynthesis tyrosine autokinase [Lentisphaerota bacterium]